MNDGPKHRLLALLALAGALAHVLAPRVLLRLASRGYATVLRVEFEPTEASVRRVRLLAAPNLLAAAYYWRQADST